MPRLIYPGDPGTERSILIDGVELSILPADLDAPPESVSDILYRLDGGASEHQRRPWFDGVANLKDRFTFSFSLSQIEGDDRIKMEVIRARGGIHRLTIWRMVPVIWTCRAGLSRYYLPSFRKAAGHLYAGTRISGPSGSAVISTDAFPIDATLNGDPIVVTYATGPTLADPGAGSVVVSRLPDATGEAADYVPIRVGGTLVTGDELMLWGCWTHEVSMRTSGLAMRGLVEDQSFVFVEV